MDNFKTWLSGGVALFLFLTATWQLSLIENTFMIAIIYFGSFTAAMFFGVVVATGYWQNYYEPEKAPAKYFKFGQKQEVAKHE